jgi:hypothetical protein
MPETTTPLVFRRTFGAYETSAPLSGEAGAFRVRLERNGKGWHAHATTYGRHLAGEWCANLAAARTWANDVYRTVNL